MEQRKDFRALLFFVQIHKTLRRSAQRSAFGGKYTHASFTQTYGDERVRIHKREAEKETRDERASQYYWVEKERVRESVQGQRKKEKMARVCGGNKEERI